MSGDQIELVKILYRFIVGKAATPFYYIVVLLQLTVITPWIVKVILGKNRKLKLLLWFVTPIYLIYLYTWNYLFGSQPKMYETLFPAWFIFYYLGLQVRCGLKWQCNGIAVVGALLISCIEAIALWITGADLSFCISQITFGSFLYSLMYIGWLFKLRKNLKNSYVTEQFGNYSYGVFYIHMFVLMLVSKVLGLLSINNWLVYSTIIFFCVAMISIFIVWLFNHFLNDKKHGITTLKVIGFQ